MLNFSIPLYLGKEQWFILIFKKLIYNWKWTPISFAKYHYFKKIAKAQYGYASRPDLGANDTVRVLWGHSQPIMPTDPSIISKSVW